MPRRRLVVLMGAAVAAVAIGVAVVLLLRGGGDDESTAVADPLAEALSYAPASAAVVVAVDTAPGSQQHDALNDLIRTFPAARFAADQVEGQLSQAGLKPDDRHAVLGGPIVLAGPPALAGAAIGIARSLAPELGPLLNTGATLSVVGRSSSAVGDVLDSASTDGRLRPQGSVGDAKVYAFRGGVVARRDATLIVARDRDAIRTVLALHDRRGGLTRTAFERRLGPLRGPGLVRVVARPRELIGAEARGVPWVDALRDGALSVRIESPGVRLRVHLTTDASRLRPQDLPIAPGPAPPRPAPGQALAATGVRRMAQTIRVLDSARGGLRVPFITPFTDALGAIDKYKGVLDKVGGIDVDSLLGQLMGTTTITTERGGLAVRAELRDGGRWRTALGRLAAIPDIALELSGITDLNIAGAGRDTFEVRNGGRTIARIAVIGDVLAASTDLGADLAAIARRAPQSVPAVGALAGRLTGPYVQDLIVTRLGLPSLARLVLGGFGDLTFSARAETSAVDGEAALALEK